MRHSALRYTSNGVIDHKLLTGNPRNVNGRYQAITQVSQRKTVLTLG